MADRYDGSIKLSLDIETQEADKRFDALSNKIKNKTSEISKTTGADFRKTVNDILESAEEITPQMERIAKSANKQAADFDKISAKNDELVSKVDTYRDKYDKATEAIHNQKIIVQELKNNIDQIVNGEVVPRSMAALQTEYDKLHSKTEKMSESYSKLVEELDKIKAKDTITPEDYDRQRQLEQIILPEMEAEWERIEERQNTVRTQLEQMRANPELIPEIQQYGDKLAVAEASLDRLIREREHFAAGAEGDITAEADSLANSYSEAQQNAQNLEYTLQDAADNTYQVEEKTNLAQKAMLILYKAAAKVANKFREMHEHSKRTHNVSKLLDGVVGKLHRKLIGVIKRVFIFTLITRALQKIRSMLSNIFNADEEMADYFSQIKANLLTAFAPLMEFVVPILKQVLSFLVGVTQYIAQVMSAIFGKTVEQSQAAAKALEQQAKATNKTAKETDKLNKSLGHLDELNTDVSTMSDSGTDEQDKTLNYVEFEISPEVQNFVENAKKWLGDIFRPFKESWDKYGASILGNLKDILDIIWEHVVEIGESFTAWAMDLNLDPIMEAFDNLLVSMKPFIDIALDGLQWVFDNILLPLAKWAVEQAIPAALDTIGGAFELLAEILNVLKPVAQWIWDNFLSPLASWTGDIIIGALNLLTNAFKGLKDWLNKNSEAVEQFLKLMVLILGPVGLITLGPGIVAGLVAGLGGLLSVFGTIAGVLFSPVGLIAALGALIVAGGNGEEVIGYLQDALAELGHFVSAVFAGDWETAWSSIMNFFIDIGNAIIAAYESIVNAVINALNSLHFEMHLPDMWIFGDLADEDVIVGIQGLANLDLSSWRIPPYSASMNTPSSKSGLSISSHKHGHYRAPGLATGTVVPASSREFLAVLGDNNKETEVVSPLSTMRQAMLEALEAYGGGGQEQTISLQIDGNELFRWLVQKNKETYLQTHQNMLIY